MHYSYELIVLPAHTVDNPKVVPVTFGAGVVKHISLVFPVGCSRAVHVIVCDQAKQLLPTNPEGNYALDGYSVEMDVYLDMSTYGNQFYLMAWNDGTSYLHNIQCHFDVEGVEEPSPNRAVLVLADAINNLVTMMRSWF
jgi:hypothetical protein